MMTFTNKKGKPSINGTFEVCTPNHMNRAVLEALVACMKDEFGDTYVDPTAYDVDALTQQTLDGILLTAAAIREDGDPMAVICIKEAPPFDGNGDLAMYIIRRPFRGYSMGIPLVKYLMDMPEAENFCSIVSHSVTYHSISQNVCYNVNLRPIGAFYSIHDNALLEHSFPKVGAKQTLLASCRAKGKKDAGTLYLPPIHRDFILGRYEAIGATCTVAPQYEGLTGDSVVDFKQDVPNKVLHTFVRHGGTDLKEVMETRMAQETDPLQTVTLFVDMCDPSAVASFELLLSMGFHFAGIHPLSSKGEYLMMHNPLAVEIPFVDYHVTIEYQEVFDYLRKHY